jgi:hypothetical protein
MNPEESEEIREVIRTLHGVRTLLFDKMENPTNSTMFNIVDSAMYRLNQIIT